MDFALKVAAVFVGLYVFTAVSKRVTLPGLG